MNLYLLYESQVKIFHLAIKIEKFQHGCQMVAFHQMAAKL